MTPGEWTPARVDLLRAEYATAEDNRALFERVNEMPGAPILSVKSMTLKAKRLGLRKADPWLGRRKGSLNFRTVTPTRSYIDVPVSDDPGIRRYQRARALIAQGRDPFRVAADVGIEPWRALGIVGEIRQERARG